MLSSLFYGIVLWVLAVVSCNKAKEENSSFADIVSSVCSIASIVCFVKVLYAMCAQLAK